MNTLTSRDVPAIASFLARDLEYSLCAATAHDLEWYRKQVSTFFCDRDTAAELRLLTMECCRTEMGLRSLEERRHNPTPWRKGEIARNEALNGVLLFVAMIVIFLVFTVMLPSGGSDVEMDQQTIGGR